MLDHRGGFFDYFQVGLFQDNFLSALAPDHGRRTVH